MKDGIEENLTVMIRPVHWMEWVIQQDLVAVQDITCLGDDSIRIIARAIHVLLETLAVGCQIVALSSILTPSEREICQTLRRTALNHIVSLFREILKKEYAINDGEFVPHAIKLKADSLLGKLLPVNDSEFYHTLCAVLLQPHQFGYAVSDPQQADELGRIVNFLRALLHISVDFKGGVMHCLNNILHESDSKYDLRCLSSLFAVDVPSTEQDLESAMGLLKGYQQLNLLGILMPVLGKEKGREIGERLILMLLEIKGELPPVLEPVANEIFRLTIILGVECEKALEYVLDKPSRKHASDKKDSGGSSFYFNFRKIIVQQVKFSYKKCLALVMKRAVDNSTSRLLLSALLEDHLSSEGDSITKGSFMEEFLNHFFILSSFCTIDASFTDRLFVLEILQKLLELDTKCILNQSHPSFSSVMDLYISFFSRFHGDQNESSTYMPQEIEMWALKINALSLLPFFLKSQIQEGIRNRLVGVLTTLVTDHLLVREADLPPAASIEKSSYTQMLSALLGAVVTSNNIDMLEILFPILQQNSVKFATKQVFKALELFGENIGENRLEAYNFCLDIITDSSKAPGLKRAIIDHLFTSLVNMSPCEFVVAWYADHIKTIVDLLEGHSHSNQTDAEKEQDLLVVRINHYTVLELLFAKVEPFMIKEKITPIVSNQLLMKLTSTESRAKNDPSPYLFLENASLWRELHVAAYKCLAAIVMCTQDQLKIYTLLFKDYTGNPLWQNLIDCDISYDHFPVENSRLSTAYNTVKGIRTEKRIQSSERLPETFSSQYMVGATISQEPSVITTFIGKGNLAGIDSIGATSLVEGDAELPSLDGKNLGASNELRADNQNQNFIDTILIDEDDFDQHPCMGVVLKLIEHLSSKFGNAHRQAENVAEWVQSLQSTLASTVTPVNIRLFLVKVVTKASKVFAQFSSIWFRPLVLAVINDPEKSGGHAFHYMLRDVCITILQWNLLPPPDDVVASRLVNHLMAVAPHETRQVLRANVEIIKTFLEIWKDHLSLDKDIIHGYLQYGGNISNPEKKITMQRSIGLQLLGAMIVSGMSFYSAMTKLNLSNEELCKVLLVNLKYKVREVFQASAELLGIALKERKESKREENDENMLEKPLRQFLMGLFRDNEFDRLLYLLDRLTYRYPSFLEDYTSLVVELLPSLHGVFRSMALEILLRHPVSLVNLQNMLVPFLAKIMLHRDEIAQLKCLELLTEIVKDLSNQKISESIIPVICEAFGTHQGEICRQQFYHLLRYLYETKAMEENKLIIHHLLMGLSDKSMAVRQIVQQFWHSQLPQTLTLRLSQILIQMHSPLLEGCWSQYANVLLLKLCESSVDYRRPIFDAPLSECEFHEQRINPSLLSGSLPMTPLFAETQALFHVTQDGVQQNSTESISLGGGTYMPRQAGKLRATYAVGSSLTLSQTQEATAVGTIQGYEISTLDSDESTQATQLQSQHQLGTLVDPVTKLKRRFYHPKDRLSQTIRGVINANKRKEAILYHQASERLSKVHMMRQYRIGELPDIEIKHEDVIGPLASLAEKDKPFANLLLRLICRGLYRTPDFWQHEVGSNLRVEIRQGLEQALSKTDNDTSFVGCIQSICLEDAEVWIKPKDIGSASLRSSNLHTGILLIENQILHETKPGMELNSNSKRHKGQAGLVTHAPEDLQKAWLELAQLYKAIGEDDYVLSIYLKNLTSQTVTHEALEAQIRGDANRALVLYEKAIDDFNTSGQSGEGTHFSQVEEEIWYAQRLACLVDLNQWGDIMEDTLVQIQNEESTGYDMEKLWDPRVQDPYLGLFIKGSVKVAAYHQMLTEFLQVSLEAPGKKDTILNEYSTEIATLALANDDLDRARHHILECYRYFRKRWSALHPLAIGRRHLQIRNLQKSVELDEFISLLSKFDSSELKRSLCEWRLRWPSPELDDVKAWDDILQNRLIFFHKVQSVVNQQADKRSMVNQSCVSNLLDVERSFSFHESAKGAMKHGSYDVAQNYMNEHLALNRGRAEKDYFDQTFFKRLVKLRCLQAERTKAFDLGETAKILQQVLDYVQATSIKPGIQRYTERQNLLKLLKGNVSGKLAWVILEHSTQSTEDLSASLESCLSLLGSSYKLYLDVLADMESENSSPERMAKASFKFACFCDEILKLVHDSRWGKDFCMSIQEGHPATGLPDLSVYPKHIVTHLMQAVSLDSSLNAQHAVARILSLLGKYPQTIDVFVRFLHRVPSWIFLPWIPQILAVLDSNEGAVFVSILETIAKSYPQALYYAFHVSKSSFGPKALERTYILTSILRSPSLETFVRALEDLTFPEKRLLDGLSHVKQCLVEGNVKLAQEAFLSLLRDCLDTQEMCQTTRQAGDYNVKFANNYSKKIIKALGQDGSKLLQMDEKGFETATDDIFANLRKASAILPTGKLSLGSFSKWMASFDPRYSNEDLLQRHNDIVALHPHGGSSVDEIEIPGQYDSYQKPDPSHHVKIVGFDQTLIGLSSKQRPKILTMRGSDEKDHKFVVKGGEDLRLDQRIQQLFTLMDSILKKDVACAKRRLSMRTYAVVPVSKHCGLLQFVENTAVLEDLIKDGLSFQLSMLSSSNTRPSTQKDTPAGLLTEIRCQYQDWVLNRGGSKNLAEGYRNMYTKVNSKEIIQKMTEMEAQIPWDSLKMGISRLATSAESYLTMRSQFARSLSVLSICGYIAGVGDRHLSNTLVDLQSGSLVSIDFGYSFGTGIILLPVPELIPFRLTRQLTNILLPMDALGILRNDMVHTMTALQAGRHLIFAVMEVFVREPLVDWKNEAIKTASLQQKQGGTRLENYLDLEKQHVELKMENAQRKLELWNPAEVTIGELQSSVHANKPYMQALESMVRGSLERNPRSRIVDKICKSVQEQVDCLIDQATDQNLLGRLWVGWQPWI
ncbi:hypothetical protein O6H91_17G090200 [Diphasiastrum complanatum]|nr:hypothetical protein O6H91_17G090200 [Diphasiastrum complanatum]